PKLTLTTPLSDILGTRASGRLVSPGVSNNLVITALQRGAAANGYTVQFTNSGTVTAGSETVNVSGNTITVDIDPAHSTATQVAAALNGNATFAALFHAGLDPDEPDGDKPVALSATVTTASGSGVEFDQSSGLQITNGGKTYTIDTSAAKTVEDFLNDINGAGASLQASINSAGTGITIQSRLSGGDFSIGENGGTTATELGLRSFTRESQLDGLNHGLGVHTLAAQNIDGNDFAIQLQDGTTFQFRLTNESTIGDVIDAINNTPGNTGQLVAKLATNGNGIELDSTATGSSAFQVQQENGSQTASDLGLIPQGSTTSAAAVAGSGGAQTITGNDVNPGETDSVFNALIRLSTALRANDQNGISRAVGLIDSATTQLNFSRAEVGARQQGLQTLQSRLDSETVDIKSAISDDIDVDLPGAISDLTAQQAAFQASLQVAGQLFKLSLLDYL
ncbi:MAG TPA: flagellin, partial [Pirellulales bacterium]